MEKITPFKFSILPGDLINALPGIKASCERMGTKAMIYLGLDIEWQMVPAIAEGRVSQVTMTHKTMEMLRPLLMSQSYIAGVESFEVAYPERYKAWCEAFKTHGDFKTAAAWYRQPQEMVDLDKHHLVPIGMPYGNIYRWQFYTYPDMACDLSKPWLDISPFDSVVEDLILINRTERCRNISIDYSFLKKYEERLLFVGLKSEYDRFKQDTELTLPLFTAKDFLELAMMIKSCSFFIGNQSLCFSLAEAMKVKRILEICPYLNNVIPSGQNGYDFWHQQPFEYYVEFLANNK